MYEKMISVIVPVYNLEKHLENSLDSLLAQTYGNIEFILVDDGSTDSSPEICDGFARRDGRVRVIHTENAGVSAARNAGLRAARGDYIGFFDGDDRVEPDMYELLMKLALDNRADIAMCEVRLVTEDGEVRDFSTGERKSWSSGREYLKELFNGSASMNVYTKLFCKSVLDGVWFPEGRKTNEDKYFLFKAALKAKRLCYDSTAKYIYYRRSGSSSITEFTRKYFDCVILADKICEDVKISCPELEENAACNKLSTVLRIYKLMYMRNGLEKFSEEGEELVRFVREFDKALAKKYLLKKDLLRFFVLRRSKGLFFFMTKHFDYR